MLCGRLCAWEGVCDANLLSRVVITIRRLIMWKFDVVLSTKVAFAPAVTNCITKVAFSPTGEVS